MACKLQKSNHLCDVSQNPSQRNPLPAVFDWDWHSSATCESDLTESWQSHGAAHTSQHRIHSYFFVYPRILGKEMHQDNGERSMSPNMSKKLNTRRLLSSQEPVPHIIHVTPSSALSNIGTIFHFSQAVYHR